MMNLKAIIFDLDDTLYDEEEYVHEAFLNTADCISDRFEYLSRDALYKRMLELLATNGRGKIFDEIIKEFNLPLSVSEVVSMYRNTLPKLSLYEDATAFLDALSKTEIKTGLITDGCSLVQHNKVNALSLETKLNFILVTDDFKLSKPDSGVYLKCLEGLGIVNPKDAVYIGDNPGKDFIGAREIGMKTIRIIRPRGMHMKDIATSEYEADVTINLLTDINLGDIYG